MTHVWNNLVIICSVLITLPIISIAKKICRFIQFYRSPSQKQDECQPFKSNLEMNPDELPINYRLLTVMLGISMEHQAIGIQMT